MTEDNKTTFEYGQPYEVYTSVGVEVDSKGNKKPSIKISVTRKISNESEIESAIQENIKLAKTYIEGVLPELQE